VGVAAGPSRGGVKGRGGGARVPAAREGEEGEYLPGGLACEGFVAAGSGGGSRGRRTARPEEWKGAVRPDARKRRGRSQEGRRGGATS
jgi:hypothetical protein